MLDHCVMARFPLIGIEENADSIHPVGPEEWWREAWYFEFFDPSVGIQFQVYQGVFPNRGVADLTCYVFEGGNVRYRFMKMDYTIPRDIGSERLCFGPLKLDLIEPFHRWRLRYDSSELQGDLLFEALHAPYSWAESRLWMERTRSGEQSRHFDQMGQYRGWICLDGEQIEISALGMRDHMWGWGARTQLRSYIILWSPFSPDLVTNAALFTFIDGRQQLYGYVHQGASRTVLQSARLDITWSERRWKSIEIVRALLTDIRGRSVELRGRPLGIIDTSHWWLHRHDHMLFSMAEYECRGLKGYGCLNWSFRTVDDRPDLLQFTI